MSLNTCLSLVKGKYSEKHVTCNDQYETTKSVQLKSSLLVCSSVKIAPFYLLVNKIVCFPLNTVQDNEMHQPCFLDIQSLSQL